MITRYPLCWPSGWKRTPGEERIHGKFNRKEHKANVFQEDGKPIRYHWETKEVSVADSVDRVLGELSRLGVYNVSEDAVISTNIQVNINGFPRSNRKDPDDPGAAVYWERLGARQCMAIDQYTRVADNLAAIAATLEAMRAIERHGGAEILNRVFTGFAELPGYVDSGWREVLGFGPGDDTITIELAESRFKELAKVAHSDQGGDDDRMRKLIEARNAAKIELATVAVAERSLEAR